MFARTFSISAKELDFGNPDEVISFMTKGLTTDLAGRRPFKFLFFSDCDRELQKIVFYDMSCLEHVIEFSGLLGRLPEYSINCDGERIKIHYFHEEKAVARVISIVTDAGFIKDLTYQVGETDIETKALKDVASLTQGFLDTAVDLQGTVIAQVMEDEAKEKIPFFTIKLDAKSTKNRAIIRSCEKMYFAWSDQDVNYMILICRFKMLPPFAVTFPMSGRMLPESAHLFMHTKKGVGTVMFTDDVSETFRIEDSKPTFE